MGEIMNTTARNTKRTGARLLGLFAALVMSGVAWAQAAPADREVSLVEFRGVPLGDAVRLLSQQTDMKIVASAGASDVPINLYLRDVTAGDALRALSNAHDLWFRADQDTGIVTIYTIDEYQRDLVSFRQETTEVFTLLYPNAIDVGVAIRDLFGDRVQLSLGIDDQEFTDELEERFERFDIVASRGEETGAVAREDRRFRSSRNRDGQSEFRRNFANTLRDQVTQPQQPGDLTARDIQGVESSLAEGRPEDSEELAEVLRRMRATIFISVIRRHNKLIVRTSDTDTLDQIRALVRKLDVPTPLVLLEVKILAIQLGDGFESVFDYDFQFGDFSGGFTTGSIDNPNRPSQPFGGSGFNAESAIAQIVGGNFSARLQVMQDENRVTTLGAPLLLTANNEVSRLFIGREIPIVTGFTEPQTRTGITTDLVTQPTPTTVNTPIGNTLLITPTINSDRTVMLRVLQQQSEVEEDGAVIPFINAQGDPGEFDIDVVRTQSVSGTVVGRDGTAVAFGGLIEERLVNVETFVPILGQIPILDFFFSRQNEETLRREVVVIIRPYVLHTPAESEGISRRLLEELSIHPLAPDGEGTLQLYDPQEVLTPQNFKPGIFDWHDTEPGPPSDDDPGPVVDEELQSP
jgi:general secretion pathway protein D